MAAPQDAVAFLELLEKSKLLSPKEVEDAIARFDLKPGQSPREVAQLLIRKRLLTRFQASQLLKGRYRGFVIDGYKLLEILGSGGMGLVYVAQDTVTGHRIAMKLLSELGQGDAGVRARFEMEAVAGEMLNHSHIVRTHKHGHSNHVDYIVMELVEAVSLEELIRQEKRIAYPQACSFICQAALGLEYAHGKGLIHRDVKPANLLVDRSGHVKLLDFGLALVEDNEDSEFALARIFGQDRLGTADYTAPEQTLDSFTVDERADVYSLGCTLYTTLAGCVPFPYDSVHQKLEAHREKRPQSLRHVAPDVPEEVLTALGKMMAKKPDDRYDSMTEVREALEPFAEQVPVSFDFPKILRERIAVAKRRMALIREKQRRRAESSASWATRGLGSGTGVSGMGSGPMPTVNLGSSDGRPTDGKPTGKTVIRHADSDEVLLEMETDTLVGADLQTAQLAGANLLAVDLTEANFSHANLREADLRQANLTGAKLTGCVLNDANLEEAVLVRADLSEASLAGCKLAGANLTQADLRRAVFNGADFSRADLTGADLSMADVKADMRHAVLACADLRGSTFTGSDLTGANLDGANVAGANFRGAIGPSGQPVFTAALK